MLSDRELRRFVKAALPAAAIGLTLLFVVDLVRPHFRAVPEAASLRPRGFPQLVSIQPLTPTPNEMCPWIPASARTSLVAALQQEGAAGGNPASGDAQRPVNADRKPERVIRDTYPTYAGIALNLQKDEVLLQDENLFGIKVFNRLDNTPAKAAFTEPKRAIAGGETTKLQFNCGIYVDPASGDIYSVTNDTINTMTVFPWDAKGEAKPKRELRTPHSTYGISVDEDAQELYLTVQADNSVVVYPKNAQGDEKPLRTLEGDSTRLSDPHGVAVDYKNKLMFVSNHGNGVIRATKSGKFDPPTITVYPLNANGDTPPIRSIEGLQTRLNWPAAMWVDSKRGELYVANDSDDSIVVFKTTDSGNVAPTRVLRGPKTGVKNPTGVFLDEKNDELWVSNMGTHAATVYRRTAAGDVPPLRTIRSAPSEMKSLAIGNPGAVAYDPNRDEILAPNCVAHAQIAMFSRMAKENTPPSRVLAGQKTLLSRTMHDIRYDALHDEFFVNNPYAYAILTFRGNASGEDAPLRIIQGPHTQLASGSRLEEDPVHNEIFVPTGGSILVFDREAQGDVAPKRILRGSETLIRGGGGVAVDPVHNLLIVGVSGNNKRPGALLIFDRTAEGNVKPKKVIAGPHTEIIRALQLQVYPPTGWIAVAQPSEAGPVSPGDTFIGFWHITDDGDVPPRWKLQGPKSTLIKPRGVTLIPSHKEIVVSDMSLNALLTYYFPEVF